MPIQEDLPIIGKRVPPERPTDANPGEI